MPVLKNKNALIVLLALFLSLIFTSPILITKNNLGIQDWDMYLAYPESARKTILDYGQFPLWNPYHCGGMPSFGHPQSNIVSITFLFVLIFGTIFGIKLSIFSHYFLFFLGLYYLSEYFKISDFGSLLTACIGSFSGVLASALGTGMLAFISVSYLPMTLLFLLKSVSDNKYVLLTALFLALNFYAGYQIILVFFPTLILFMVYYIFKKGGLIALGRFLTILIIFGILVSPKLILSINLLRENPRYILDDSGYILKNILYFLLSRSHEYNQALPNNTNFGIDENSIYIGILPFILVLTGLITMCRKKPALIILFFLNFWLMLGNQIKISLYNLLRNIYFYDFFRVAQRFRFNLIIFIALFTGLGFDFFYNKIRFYKKFHYFYILLFSLVFFDLVTFSYNNFLSKTFVIKNPENSKRFFNQKTSFTSIRKINVKYQATIDSSFLSQYFGNGKHAFYLPWSSEYLALKQNYGTTWCYEPIPVKISVLTKDDLNYRGEAFYLSTDKKFTSLPIKSWSPNKVVVETSIVVKNSKIFLNQNFDHGWWVMVGNISQKADNNFGLVSFKINQTSKKVVFLYNPYKIF